MKRKGIAELLEDFKAQGLQKKSRIDSYYTDDGELIELRKTLNGLVLEKLQRSLSGEAEGDIDEKINILSAREQELAKQIIKEPLFNCEKCQDTGLFNGKNCICLLEKLYVECYGAMDIKSLGVSFDTFDLSVFDDSENLPGGKTQRSRMSEFLELAKLYLSEFPASIRKNLFITGKTGLGKSYLLYCMAAKAYLDGIDVMLIRATDLYDNFFLHRMGNDVDLSYLNDAALLLIDDLGAEPSTQNVTVEYLYDLLSYRMENKKNTVVASNLTTIEELANKYDGRIASRLRSKKDFLAFNLVGSDLRMNLAKKKPDTTE